MSLCEGTASHVRALLVRLQDLEFSPMRLVEWAIATLGEEMNGRLTRAIAVMAGKTKQWKRLRGGDTDSTGIVDRKRL